jgi:diguanylate cyclase (GGDEF)-like protein
MALAPQDDPRRKKPQAARPALIDLDAPDTSSAGADGQIEPGNIDLAHRPRVKNPDGSISTVRSMSVGIDGREVLLPTVSEDGRIMPDSEAVAQYRKTGRHLGIFRDPASATAYAERLHREQAAGLDTGLIDLDAPDSTPAAGAAGAPSQAPTHGPAAVYSGGRMIEQNGAPVRRRGVLGGVLGGIGERIAGMLGGIGEQMGVGPESSAGTSATRLEEPEDTRRLVRPTDRRTAEERYAEERHGVEHQIGAPRDQTAVMPVGSPQANADRAKTAAGLTRKSADEASFTPGNLRDVAKRGVVHAAELNRRAVELQPWDPATAEALHQEAEDASRKAYNAQVRADQLEQSDTFGEIARSSMIGIIHDPNATAKRNAAEYAADPAFSFSPEDQTKQLGRATPVGRDRGFDFSKDVTAPLAGSLPLYIAGGMAGRLAMGGIAGALDASAPRAASLVRALSHEIESTSIYGPKQAGMAGLREAGANLAENAPRLALRGATEGQVVGATQAAREAQQTGGDPVDAAIMSTIGNVIGGALPEVALGGVARVLGVADRSIAGALDRVIERADGYRGVREQTWRDAVGVTQPLDRKVLADADAGADVAGKTPVSDKTAEGQRVDLARALEGVLEQKRASGEPARGPALGPDAPPPADARWWENELRTEPLVEGVEGMRARPEPGDENTPLRSAEDVAAARAEALAPRDEVNATVQMHRAAEDARLMQEQAIRDAEGLRIEQAAQARAREKQGPLTLAQTIARAGRDRDAGDPLAADYHEAINTFADVNARMQDAGKSEQGPGEKLKLDYARAKSALNTMRRKYGTQIGGAALLALAGHDGDLTDDERKFIGVAGLALSTGTHRMPPALVSAVKAAVDRAGRGARMSPQEWLGHLVDEGVILGSHYSTIRERLLRDNESFGVGEEHPIDAARMHELLDELAGTGADAGRGFVSRLSTHIEGLPKKWDQPTPAQQWLDYLGKKGQPYNPREFDQALRDQLRYAAENKHKLTRDQVLQMAEVNRPKITLQRLTEGGRDTEPLELQPADPEAAAGSSGGGRRYNTMGDDYGDGPAVAALREEYDRAVEDATEQHARAEDVLNERYRAVRDAAREVGVPESTLHRALSNNTTDGDYGPIVDPDAVFRWLQDQGAIDSYPKLRDDADVQVVRGDAGDYTIRSRDADDVLGTGQSELEAIVNAERDRPSYVDLGGENPVLTRSQRVAPLFDTMDEGYATSAWAIRTDDPDLMGAAYYAAYYDRAEAERVLAADRKPQYRYDLIEKTADDPGEIDRWGIVDDDVGEGKPPEIVYGDASTGYDDAESLLNDYIAEHWQVDESRYDDLTNALARYADEQESYGEVESNTYGLREGSIEDSGWEEQFRDAQQADEEAAEEERVNGPRAEYVNGGNDEYWDLDEDDRALVDRFREQGAIGTVGPIGAPEHPDPLYMHGAAYDASRHVPVFDPALPHTPLPSPGERRAVNDPDQVQFEGFGEGSGLAVVTRMLPQPGTGTALARSNEPRTLPALAGDGRTHWAGVQTVPGGKRYRELLLVADNTPGEKYTGRNASSHRHYQVDDLMGHLRVADRLYFANDVETPAIATLRASRERFLARLNAITAEHEAMPPADRMNPNHPNVQRLHNEYLRVNAEQNRIGVQEEAARAALPSRKGVVPEAVVAADERQTDFMQDATRNILPDGMEPSPEVLAKIAKLAAAGEPIPDEWKLVPEGFRERKALTPEEQALDRQWRDEATAAYEESQKYSEQAQALRTQHADLSDAHKEATYDAGYSGPYISSSIDRWAAENGFTDARNDYVTERLRLQRLLAEAEQLRDDARVRGEILQQNAENLAFVNPMRPPRNAFADPETIDSLLAGRLLLEGVEADADRIAWSHSSNRMAFSQGYSKSAAALNYDKRFPSSISRILRNLGFKDVKPELITLSGYRYWSVPLTPEMKAAIKRVGIPLLTVAGLMAAPEQAGAQGSNGRASRADLYGTGLGGIAAGAIIATMLTSKKVRSLIKENRALSRALHLDDLSGLSNKRALARAIESVDHDPAIGWATFDANSFKAMNDVHGHPEGDRAIAHFGRTIIETAEKLGVPMRGFRAGGDEFAFAAPKERLAEVVRAVEAASPYTKGEVTTSLTGAHGDTFAEADALLTAVKAERRVPRGETGSFTFADKAADLAASIEANQHASTETPGTETEGTPTAAAGPAASSASSTGITGTRRDSVREREELLDFAAQWGGTRRSTEGANVPHSGAAHPLEFYANPIGPALQLLRRSPGTAGLVALGYTLDQQDDNELLRRTGKPIIALAALHAIGARRIAAGTDMLAQGLVEQLRKTRTGTKVARAFNPDRAAPPRRAGGDQGLRARARGGHGQGEPPRDEGEGPRPRGGSRRLRRAGQGGVGGPRRADARRALRRGRDRAGDRRDDEAATRRRHAGPGLGAAELRRAAQVRALRGRPRARRQAGRLGRAVAEPAHRQDEHAHARPADPRGRACARHGACQRRPGGDSGRDRGARRGAVRELLGPRPAGRDSRVVLPHGRGHREGVPERRRRQAVRVPPHDARRGAPGVGHRRGRVSGGDGAQARGHDQGGQGRRRRARVATRRRRSSKLKRRFKQKDTDYVALPDSPSYGMLRGAIVQRDVAHSLEGFGKPGMYSTMLRQWKELKTVFNLGTNVGNILSNSTSLHVAGMPVWMQPLLLRQGARRSQGVRRRRARAHRGGRDARQCGERPMARRATSATMRSPEGLEELLATTRPETADVIRRESSANSEHAITEPAIAGRASKRRLKGALVGAGVGALKGYDEEHPERTGIGAAIGAALGALAASGKGDIIRRLYGHEDNLARIAWYHQRRAHGDTHEARCSRRSTCSPTSARAPRRSGSSPTR